MGVRLALLVGLLVGCDDTRSTATPHQIYVRSPVAGVVYIGARAIAIPGERTTRVGGLGPPPHTLTFVADGGLRVTVVDIPGDTVDLVSLLNGPDSRPGNLVRLPVRPLVDDTYELIGVVNERILRAEGGFIRLPSDTPADLWAVWRRDGQVTGMSYRRINRPEAWSAGLEIRPTIPLDATIDVQIPEGPRGWVRAELTLGGLRTGLILGEGLAGPDDAIRIRRPRAAEIPDAGLWLEATATDLEQAVHVALETDEAGLTWPADPGFSPRPGAVDAGSIIARDSPRVRWDARPGLFRADLELTDGCTSDRWQIIAPAEAGSLDLPLPPGRDPLSHPLITGTMQLDTIGDAAFDARVEGALGPRFTLPQHTNRVQIRGTTGAWRSGLATCTPVDLQGTWYVTEQGVCDGGSPAQTVVIDRCGAVIPIPADPELCGAVAGRALVLRAGGRFTLSAEGAGWRIGDRWRLRPPLEPVEPAPPELRGAWFQVSASEQPYEPGPDGGPGFPRDSETILSVGAPADGPWAEFDFAGRLSVRLPGHELDAILLGFDGATARLAIEGRACETPPTAVARAEDGQLVIEEWVPAEGLVRRWRLARR